MHGTGSSATEGSMPTTTTTAAQVHPSGDKRFKMLDAAMKRHGFEAAALLEILHQAHELFGFLADDVLIYIGRSLKLPLARVYGVATFYNYFSLKPKGEHTCTVCMGTACYVKGAGEIVAAVAQACGVRPGETTADGRLSLVEARCVGACGIAPAVVFDSEVVGKQTAETVLARVKRWTEP
jgi:bidirectional [NiFe] hydrogenase diaphorase subunit